MTTNVLAGGKHLPLALLRRSALDANRSYMRKLAKSTGASLCPHVKTTMSPELVAEHLADGFWGMTAATVGQAQYLHEWGARRIVLANQVVDPANLRSLVQLQRDESLDLYVLVDSVESCDLLAAHADASRPMQVLLEVGAEGGRTGVRDLTAAIALAGRIAATPTLRLRGIEGFENVFQGATVESDRKVNGLLDGFEDIAKACEARNYFAPGEVLLSAGGSAHYDRAIDRLQSIKLVAQTRVVIRAGCTITHDHGIVARAFERIQGWANEITHGEAPSPALEIWSAVQSIPEPGLAILAVGKRDLSFDMDLPLPIKWTRDNQLAPLGKGHVIERLNDHHAYLRMPVDSPLRIGDLVGLGISHPCTTFDRWRSLLLVDDQYQEIGVIRTYFREEDRDPSDCTEATN